MPRRVMVTECHPDRPHRAFGLCDECYSRWRVAGRPCHPDGTPIQLERLSLGKLASENSLLCLCPEPDFNGIECRRCRRRPLSAMSLENQMAFENRR
jgi:hypothetical protein